MINKRHIVFLSLLLSTSCFGFWREDIKDSAPTKSIDVSKVPDAVPKVEPHSTLGNPPYYDVNGIRYYVATSSKDYHENGYASWYGTKFHGRKTSSGEPYDMFAMTAANKTLPIPCYVRVTNLENGRQVIVRVNDRGPFLHNRIIDLSYAAATKLDMLKKGTAHVQVDAIDPVQYQQEKGFVHTLSKPHKAYKTANGEKLYLQIGSFQTKSAAKNFLARLKTVITEPVKIYEVKLMERPIYRIKIGPIYDEIDGIAINQHLKSAGLTGGVLTRANG